MSHNIAAEYKNDNRDPDELYIAGKEIDLALSYSGTDGNMMYHALCDNAAGAGGVVLSDGNDTKTLTPIDSGHTKSFTVRSNSSDGTRRDADDSIGCRVMKFSSQLNYNGTGMLLDTIIAKGKNYLPSGYQGDTAPLFADGQTIQKEYTDNSLHTITWDGDELRPYMNNFGYVSEMFNKSTKVDSQLYPKWIRSGRRVHGITMEFLRKDAIPHSIYADFRNQSGSTFKDLNFKIYQSPTQFRQYAFTNVAIIKMPRAYTVVDNVRKPTYQMQAVAQSVIITEKDGVTPSATGFYGIEPA